MSPLPFVVREVKALDDASLDAAETLYESSFPIVERVPFAALVEHLGNLPPAGYERHLLVAEAGSELAGLSSVLFLPSICCGFVMYIAVAEPFRGVGLGERVLTAAVDKCRSDAAARGLNLRGVLLEVERPEDAAGVAERKIRDARLRFFETQGARVLTDTYRQPPAWVGAPEVPLNLLYLPCDEAWPTESAIAGFYRVMFGYGADQPAVTDAIRGYRVARG